MVDYREILRLDSQDIYEQSRKIVDACEKAESSLNRGSAPNPGV